MKGDGGEGEVTGYGRGAHVFCCDGTEAARGLNEAGGRGVLHINFVVHGFALCEVAEMEVVNREGEAAAIFTQDVESAVVNMQMFDCGVGTGKVCGTAGREVFMIGAASDGRHDDVQVGDLDELHALAKQEEVAPTALHNHLLRRAERRKIGRGLAAQRETDGDKAGVGEVGAMVLVNLDLARSEEHTS